jgi:putative AdoMet-dependent methyltransferase
MTSPLSFPASDFDSWAAAYDESVQAESSFPFDGYSQVLQQIVRLSSVSSGQSVLDLGTGTANLALLFAEQGCRLTCTDFSQAMLDLARKKLPQADFILHDLGLPLPSNLGRFDAIVSAYAFHHFPLTQKIEICQRLFKETLAENGRLVIGDISFSTFTAQETFKQSIPDWEDDYWFADEALNALRQAGFSADYIQVSACAGVYEIRRGD